MNELKNIWTKNNLAIFIVWLFHLSAIIGISLGYFDWFVTKTPLNLVLIGILILLTYPINTQKSMMIAVFFYIMGMAVEWVGVQYDFLFGSYSYGDNLGPKIDGVPWLIGVTWMVLTLATAAIATRLFKSLFMRVLTGASLMVFLDIFIEQTAPMLDFWHFSDGFAPLRNYMTWFVISALLHYVYQRSNMKGSFMVSLHIYLAQLVFFIYFYGIYGF